MSTHLETRIEYNKFTDEHFITIPDDVIELLELKMGDILVWSIETNRVCLKKREDN